MRLDFINIPRCPAAAFAARELEDYLNRMIPDGGQAGLFVCFTLHGESAPAEPGHLGSRDCFEIHAAPEKIEISASNPRSVLLGVYRLLFELGCRFLMPGRAHELVPRIPLSALRADISETASYGHRGVCIEGADSLENILDFIDWLPKVGCNSFFLQHLEPESFLNGWYQHKYNPLRQDEKIAPEEMERMYRTIDAALAERALVHHRVGHGWTSRVIGFDHACMRTGEPTPAQQRLLALVNGKRLFWGGVPSNTNLCYSQPEVQQAFVRAVVEYASAHPEVDYLHVWLADEYNNICECPECSKTTLPDQYIGLLNKIDAELTRLGLPTHIVMLLYTELLWPPKEQALHNPARFTLMFAPISRTFEHSYDECGDIPPIVPYHRNKIELPHTLEANIAFLRAWQKQCPMDSFVYDYPLGRAHYGDLGYYRIAQIISRDIKALPSLGLNGYISCQELRAAFPNSFPEYVMARTLWDRELPFDALEGEYFSALYGEQWREARDYLSRLSALCSCDYFNGIGPRADEGMARRFRGALACVDAFRPQISEHIAQCSGLHKKAWKLLDYHAEYCKLMLNALAALAEGRDGEAQPAWACVMRYIRVHEPDLQPYLDVYRVLEVATKYTGFALDMPR